ncbi:carbonic anhydrase 9 isoform X2 [Octopus bimaculoides]|uniref:carbonic anhydrase 9 isoform X2 n=1 Tax=Octopus bimaculoides TaxID=37653 RepID=UPI00071E5910|nr:carbonic anhydrase 9 isoform X2 [Octopus bimaculoides]|eukprot:XP_014786584.1 PREDICTED: carbonic anhydrase 9-like isoform X2 [Octopus bimaculoides]
MTNTGHTVTLKLQKGLHLQGGGLTEMYIAHKMAFHWGSVDIIGSEHLLEGRRYPMEVQIYHYSYKFTSEQLAWKKGHSLVVVAYFVQTGVIENSAFHEIINNLRMINFKDNQYRVKNWNLEAFLPRNRSCFITYRGSVTFPPCREGVTWIILWETVHISTGQVCLKYFALCCLSTAREDREYYWETTSDHFSRSTTEGSTVPV